ncbi:MAG: hypoxanthine phosphoribosyltransferase [Elusimicrobia bacterium]|nr:hypoxanthine phosphoribosyltransferase [Elusimicrobiota bacterium]
MLNDIEEIVFSEKQIQKRVKELAKKISNDYKGKKLTLVPILKGATVFLADLIKNITIHLNVSFMTVSSYKNTESKGVIKLTMDLKDLPEGRDFLIVEDIVDTGRTVNFVLKKLKTVNPKSVKICTLLNKPSRRLKDVNINIDYTGFNVPDKFVVGYGMDFNESYRNLPYIAVLKQKIYKQQKETCLPAGREE